MTLAYMFPGQGAQHLGMGKDLFPLFPEECRLARQALGYSIEEFCANGGERLNDTRYTQPAIFFVSCLDYLRRRRDGAPAPDLVLGHSLGLYAALFAARVFDIGAGLEIVARRGQLMAESSEGAMIAVLGVKAAKTSEYLLKHGHHEVDVGNYNTFEQVVLSGRSGAIARAQPDMEAEGFRCIRLSVSGPFHSRYMDPARVSFARFLTERVLSAPGIPVISTTSAATVSIEHMIEELSFQLVRPVRWLQTVTHLMGRFPGMRFQEIGPGEVLTGLNRNIVSHLEAAAASGRHMARSERKEN